MATLIIVGAVIVIGIIAIVITWLRFLRQEKLYEEATKADKEPWGV